MCPIYSSKELTRFITDYNISKRIPIRLLQNCQGFSYLQWFSITITWFSAHAENFLMSSTLVLAKTHVFWLPAWYLFIIPVSFLSYGALFSNFLQISRWQESFKLLHLKLYYLFQIKVLSSDFLARTIVIGVLLARERKREKINTCGYSVLDRIVNLASYLQVS